jgi:hypothetical protein
MKKNFARVLAAVGLLVAGSASVGCIFFLGDEPKAPKSLVD